MTASTKTLDLTKAVQTRDGRKVRILCTDRIQGMWPVAALVTDPETGDENFCSYTLTGDSPCRLSGWGLVNVPEETVKYMAYYGKGYTNKVYDTEEEARKFNRLFDAILKITSTGEGYDRAVTKVELVS